ncbi:hypothetical protein [Nocardiopsis aegyptia]|uniref:Uncharacterized protein n=1 Tax=Nocardiopsis aegyptia TaxID=220378 RepID=A0A7Z0EL51_9ACTN|nr:hypothetical protein [Nocardiopsis aegyptia]NYJ33280.1 hypothetical protein [Nocardiopsis aegyptia]
MENNSTRQSILLAITPEALRAEADALATEEAPRRFAVFAMDDDEQDGVILAWGQYFGDGRVVLTGDAAPIHGRFGSLRSALRVCSRGDTQTYVSWVDPAPKPEAVPSMRTTRADAAVPDLQAIVGTGETL